VEVLNGFHKFGGDLGNEDSGVDTKKIDFQKGKR
jgi:hypothetical protein